MFLLEVPNVIGDMCCYNSKDQSYEMIVTEDEKYLANSLYFYSFTI